MPDGPRSAQREEALAMDPTTALGWMAYGISVSGALLATFGAVRLALRAEEREAKDEAPDSLFWRPRF